MLAACATKRREGKGFNHDTEKARRPPKRQQTVQGDRGGNGETTVSLVGRNTKDVSTTEAKGR